MNFNTNLGVVFDQSFTQEDTVCNKVDCIEIFVEHCHGGEFSEDSDGILSNDILALLYYIACETGYKGHSQEGFNIHKLSRTLKDVTTNTPESIANIKHIGLIILMECLRKNGMTLCNDEDKILNSGYLLDELADSIIVKGDKTCDYWHYAELVSHSFIYYGSGNGNKKPVYQIHGVEFNIAKALETLHEEEKENISFDVWLKNKKDYWKKAIVR